jgi:hypothetical protein
VGPPERRGFGLRLIERSAAADLGGTVWHNQRAEGLRCAIEAPLGHQREPFDREAQVGCLAWETRCDQPSIAHGRECTDMTSAMSPMLLYRFVGENLAFIRDWQELTLRYRLATGTLTKAPEAPPRRSLPERGTPTL